MSKRHSVSEQHLAFHLFHAGILLLLIYSVVSMKIYFSAERKSLHDAYWGSWWLKVNKVMMRTKPGWWGTTFCQGTWRTAEAINRVHREERKSIRVEWKSFPHSEGPMYPSHICSLDIFKMHSAVVHLLSSRAPWNHWVYGQSSTTTLRNDFLTVISS